jgi:hypothetical protein
LPSEQVRFWLESTASIIGLIGVFAIALELLRARKADERDFLFHTYEKFEKIAIERGIIQNLEFTKLDELVLINYSEGDVSTAYFKVFNYWDLLTKTVQSGAISSKTAAEHFAFPFMTYYEKYSPYIHDWFKIIGEYGQFDSFDWFAEECKRLVMVDSGIPKRQQEYIDKVKAQAS